MMVNIIIIAITTSTTTSSAIVVTSTAASPATIGLVAARIAARSVGHV